MPKWETYDDFMFEHLTLVRDICERCITVNEAEVQARTFELWDLAKDFASRSHTTLAFDCAYIVANATGNKVSVSLLQNISADLLNGRRVKAMASYRDKLSKEDNRWYLSARGKSAIMKILQGDETLYIDVVGRWINDQDILILGDSTDHWCEPCGVRSVSGQSRLDIVGGEVKSILMCPGCKKWEWDERSV